MKYVKKMHILNNKLHKKATCDVLWTKRYGLRNVLHTERIRK